MSRPTPEALVMYGSPTDQPAPDWSWVDEQLGAAGLYWVDVAGDAPHPRPVWGVWDGTRLHLSVGSPPLNRRFDAGGEVTVHLESALDVVILNGRFVGRVGDAAIVDRYDEKYDFRYDLERYGPLAAVEPDEVLAWRASGAAGRDGFVATGRWRFG